MSSVLNAISKQLEKAGGSQNISNQLLDLFIWYDPVSLMKLAVILILFCSKA